jgi:hypothetical protein
MGARRRELESSSTSSWPSSRSKAAESSQRRHPPQEGSLPGAPAATLWPHRARCPRRRRGRPCGSSRGTARPVRALGRDRRPCRARGAIRRRTARGPAPKREPSSTASMRTTSGMPSALAMSNAPLSPAFAPFTDGTTCTEMLARSDMSARQTSASCITCGDPMSRCSTDSSSTTIVSGGSARSRISCRSRRAATSASIVSSDVSV